MELRTLTHDDVGAIVGFFERVPAGERTFFKEDVLGPGTVERWLADERGRRLLACDDGEVVGYVAVLPGTGWTEHVGEVRLVVDPTRRRQGIGRTLARRAVLEAIDLGLSKIIVEVIAEQEGAVAMFQELGFRAEGLLADHVRDREGGVHDLVLLSHQVHEQWAAMATTGIDEAVDSAS